MTIATQDLYLDEAGRVVPAGADAAFLLVRAGKPVPKGYVEPKAPKKPAVKKPVKKAPVKKAPVKRRKAGKDKAVKAGGDK